MADDDKSGLTEDQRKALKGLVGEALEEKRTEWEAANKAKAGDGKNGKVDDSDGSVKGLAAWLGLSS